MPANGPNRLLRAVARTPIAVYRAGLGFLFGHRLLLLEHLGRRTGLPRYAVLEVVARPEPDRYVVPSGFGERAQWFRNVLAHPQVRVRVGRGPLVPAHARVLAEREAAAVLREYVSRHPLAWRVPRPVLRRMAPGLAGGPDEIAARIPLVELTPRR
jgi:deazaflavin-dependent oxidoreductase (nitroreductase family)